MRKMITLYVDTTEFNEIMRIWVKHELNANRSFGKWLDIMNIKCSRPWKGYDYVDEIYFEEKEYLAFRIKYV